MKHCNGGQTIASGDGTLQRRTDRLHEEYNRTLQYLPVARTTVNGAPRKYGRYRKRCNKAPYVLYGKQGVGRLDGAVIWYKFGFHYW